MKRVRRFLFAALVVLVLLAAFALVKQPDNPASANQVFRLQAPSFVAVARAAEGSIASVIGDEAGIAAYFDAATTIDLNNVRGVYRTIEEETADYVVGSVEVENYPESEDVHVYVHKDGWILAYYLAADPVAKIFDWRAYHSSGRTDLTTKLENTLVKVAGFAVVAYSGCTYYDFRYPNATHLMLIAEWAYDGTDSFEVNLPGSFTFDERSWSLGVDDNPYGDQASYELDGVEIASFSQGWQTVQGTLTAAQLLPAQFHTISIWGEGGSYPNHGYGGLALVYRVP